MQGNLRRLADRLDLQEDGRARREPRGRLNGDATKLGREDELAAAAGDDLGGQGLALSKGRVGG
jgi:hypothetical protein